MLRRSGEKYRGGSGRRSISRRVRGEDFDEVLARIAVQAPQKTRAKDDVFQITVDIDVVANVLRIIKVVRGFSPVQLHLKVAKTVGENPGRDGGRSVVIGIRRERAK